MFDSIAFNVVTGLIFIYLLYSLFATIISEIIATKLSLRARNLKEAVNRMLNDEDNPGFLKRLWDSINILKTPDNKVIKDFYNHPEIKYLGSSGVFKSPSTFKAVSFSKTMLNYLFGDGAVTKEKIEARLDEIVKLSEDGKNKFIDKDTAKYIQSLWVDSFGDLIKFKLQLEGWFDRTMEQATEWYKRKIQVILLVIGFFIAWIFNADTFVIIKKLSTDKDAREKIVSMANAYVENNRAPELNTSNDISYTSYKKKLDSLLEVKKKLEADMADANSVLGIGGWPPDFAIVKSDKKTNIKSYSPAIDIDAIPDVLRENDWFVSFRGHKWCYFFNLLCAHFWGFLITAIAISLGAPFWFDLLNKMMKLRTSAKQETDSANVSSPSVTVSSLSREG